MNEITIRTPYIKNELHQIYRTVSLISHPTKLMLKGIQNHIYTAAENLIAETASDDIDVVLGEIFHINIIVGELPTLRITKA